MGNLLTYKNYNIYSSVSIIIVAAILVLMFTNVIPVNYFYPALVVSIILFAGRIVLKIYFYKQKEKKFKGG